MEKTYTVTLAIFSRDNLVTWSGQEEVTANDVAGAAEAGMALTKSKHHVLETDTLHVLRTQAHAGVFHTGEVDDLIESGAHFSPDRLYRYSLHRIWDSNTKPAMFIGLNPSTADERLNDPTVRRCLRFAKDWGYGGLIMTNAFGLRATSPKVLLSAKDPVGPENNACLLRLANEAGIVIAAWGNHGGILNRSLTIKKLLPHLNHLGLTGVGQPKHPLYLAAASKPQPW